MTIFLGADHGGYALKEIIKTALTAWGYAWEDEGNTVLDPSDDYPLYALAVAKKVARDLQNGKNAKGILVCRTAAGMAIVANKVKGIRAAAPHDIQSAILSREHNDANILVLAGDFLGEKEALEMLKAWLTSECTGEERHIRRLEQIRRFERHSVEVIPGIGMP
ncbi:RpiB/LacA/LacB family sugar-phosphate isomerase [Candidatus Gottesmanbacteria bacterium]|nr:RpiB/LacA/LacB family sugar-phosphate isomerase [Candidatus Gottesmanbacteria bacterium]